jgi:small subunit ribosomal protein S17
MPKRILEGVVVSDKADKTVIVRVERTFLHPLLKKTVRRSKKYHAHDEANVCKEGEVVRIAECAPKSKLKTWEVVVAEGAAEPKAKASRAKKTAAPEAAEDGASA